MLLSNLPIRKKLTRIIFLINGIVLVVTCIGYFVYELYIFRKTSIEKLATIGKIIAANSTASLSFDSPDDAKETLGALKTEPHITAAILFDTAGHIFAAYASPETAVNELQSPPEMQGYRFIHSNLEGVEPVAMDKKQLGWLYLKSDLGDMYNRLRLFAIVSVLVIVLSIILAWLLSRMLTKTISKPILDLAATAKIISEQNDYTVRAVKHGKDEIGTLTAAFNHMLDQIHTQNNRLEEFNQNLEQKVAERTLQLESANREMEAFSYSISHDLRAPLRAVIGFTSILEEDYSSKLDSEAQRVTGIIKSSTLKMGQLIDDLLAFSRTGRHEIVKTVVETNQLVQDIISEISSSGKHNMIRWEVSTLPQVEGDINALRQVWINLVANAVKYSAKKDLPHIEIGSFEKEEQTVFFVKDNGAGFDQQYQHKLFRVFQRLHSSEDFEGTGVGLALVEKIVSKHLGKVWAEGIVDVSASFYFSLPNK